MTKDEKTPKADAAACAARDGYAGDGGEAEDAAACAAREDGATARETEGSAACAAREGGATAREARECGLRVREAGGDGRPETICGTAIVFGVESVALDEGGMTFREVIAPEAVGAAWLATQDVKLNLLHDRSQTIGRSDRGRGNLRLTVTPRGVDFEMDVNPEIPLHRQAAALIREGVYTGCSFEFRPKRYGVNDNRRPPVVTHRELERLTALTIGMDPAYRQTSVSVRELIAGAAADEDTAYMEREAAEDAETAEEAKAAEEREAAEEEKAAEARRRTAERRGRELRQMGRMTDALEM